jgi:uncharacterized protein YneF (UPF0154 family)
MLDTNYYKQFGGVAEYLRQQKILKQMGKNPTQYQRLQRNMWIDQRKNPSQQKLQDIIKEG